MQREVSILDFSGSSIECHIWNKHSKYGVTVADLREDDERLEITTFCKICITFVFSAQVGRVVVTSLNYIDSRGE